MMREGRREGRGREEGGNREGRGREGEREGEREEGGKRGGVSHLEAQSGWARLAGHEEIQVVHQSFA